MDRYQRTDHTDLLANLMVRMGWSLRDRTVLRWTMDRKVRAWWLDRDHIMSHTTIMVMFLAFEALVYHRHFPGLLSDSSRSGFDLLVAWGFWMSTPAIGLQVYLTVLHTCMGVRWTWSHRRMLHPLVGFRALRATWTAYCDRTIAAHPQAWAAVEATLLRADVEHTVDSTTLPKTSRRRL